MTLVAHAILGIAAIGLIVWSNPAIFSSPASGPKFTALELLYYASGSFRLPWGGTSTSSSWSSTPMATGNVFSGNGSWMQFVKLGYANPAAGSASQDYTIGNVDLLPMFTIIDGYRCGIRRPDFYHFRGSGDSVGR